MKLKIIIILSAILIVLNIFASFGHVGFPLPFMLSNLGESELSVFPIALIMDLIFAVAVLIFATKIAGRYTKQDVDTD